MGKMVIKLMHSMVLKGDNKRLAKQEVPQGTVVEDGLVYLDDGHPLHTFNITRPEGAEGKLPAILDIHGGAWIYGDRHLNRNYSKMLALGGYAVLDAGYRIAPEATFEEQARDVIAFINYVADHADELNIDSNNLFLTGDSSGGHLSYLALEAYYRPEVAELLGCKPKVAFNAVCFTCGAFYMGDMPASIPCSWLFFKPIFGKQKDKGPYQSLTRLDMPAGLPLPPMLLHSCEDDFLKADTLKAYEALKAAGYEPELIFRKEITEHKLRHVYNIAEPWWSESKDTNGKILAFFDKYKK